MSSHLIVMKEEEDSVSVMDPGLILFNFDGCMRDQSTKSKKKRRTRQCRILLFFLPWDEGTFA